ncbi:hypothetical protein [Arenicella xantha]|uniref:Uncharacterized protein n=1 Tax=Arenicella xantha TaxID=644221 RepID=A0A395JLM2_9GAMM|nr:hypothetical protein [Arenicella xantha]RBP51611.1 hypothetical protein DFR28_1021041 [Arenicella xantha]
MTIKYAMKVILASILLSTLISTAANAAFPNDFSDVTWIDPNVSGWSQTSQISVNVSGSRLIINDTKRNVWPARYHNTLRNSCCNRSLWIFIKYEGRWYATTFEYMRYGQTDKNIEAVNGQQIKRAPFLRPGFEWKPAKGEVYGFMTSGMARFNLLDNNVAERSNVALYRWEEGPTNNINFEEVPRGPDGRPIDDVVVPEEPEEPEVCVEPEPPVPENRLHTYSGTANATIAITGGGSGTSDFTEPMSILLNDDRTMLFTVDDESFNTTVQSNGSFSGQYTFDIGGVGTCIVVIDVVGTVVGKNAAGTASGSKSCGVFSATLNATFLATSPTAPSYLDERAPLPAPRKMCVPPLSPMVNLLLTEDD